MSSNNALVLLLEDEPLIALDMEETLREAGFGIIVTFDTAKHALAWLAESAPAFAIADPRLKDGFCVEVVALLLERSIPFIVYSGDADIRQEEGFRQGIWLAKPASPEEVNAALDTLVKARR
jgi:DNA-binding response OmpR family regulator